MHPNQNPDIVKLFLDAAEGIIPAPGRKAWDHGWAYEDYRRSGRAALTGPHGSVTMTPEALSSWETAVERLLGERRVRARWDLEEFWEIAGSLAVAASIQGTDARTFLTGALDRIRSVGPAFTLQMIANVTWDEPPMVLGDSVIGRAGHDLLNAAETAAHGRTFPSPERRQRWLEQQVGPRTEADLVTPVAICCWTPGQQSKAVVETERKLRDVVDLPLLFELDLGGHQVFRRGDVNRPGVRGLTLDRGAIENMLKGLASSIELASFPLTVNEVFDAPGRIHWYSAEPLPLGGLLRQDYLKEAVISAMADDPIARSVRLAARWFAEAHYTNASDDAALALGVGLDALLSGKQALASSAMADRFALLWPEPTQRKTRRQSYLTYFGVRSSIAHGGRSSKLDQVGFLEAFFALVRDAAWRLLDLKNTFAPASDDALDNLFDDLRLGVKTWPPRGDSAQIVQS